MNEKAMRQLVAAGVIRGPYPTKKERLRAWKIQIEKAYEGRVGDADHRQDRD